MNTPDRHPEFPRAIAALMLVQLLFGVHYSAAREVTSLINPANYAIFRILGGSLLLSLIAWRGGLFRWSIRDWKVLSVLGFFGIAVNQILFNEGIARSTAIHAVLVMATIPSQTLILSVLHKQEELTFKKALSVMLGLVGICLLNFEELSSLELYVDREGNAVESIFDTVLAGDILMLLNSLAFSYFLVLSRIHGKRFTSTELTTGCYLASIPAVLLYGLLKPLISPETSLAVWDLPTEVWTPFLIGLIAFAIIGPSVMTYFLNFYAIKRLPVSLVGFFVYLQFIVAAITGYLWHAERFDAWSLTASFFVLGGLTVRFLPSRKGGQPRPEPALQKEPV